MYVCMYVKYSSVEIKTFLLTLNTFHDHAKFMVFYLRIKY